MGAHTIGVMRREDLGFDAPTGWVLDEHIFNNGFHQALTGRDGDLSKPPNWVQRLVRNSNLPDRWQWVAVPEGELAVMLNRSVRHLMINKLCPVLKYSCISHLNQLHPLNTGNIGSQ